MQNCIGLDTSTLKIFKNTDCAKREIPHCYINCIYHLTIRCHPPFHIQEQQSLEVEGTLDQDTTIEADVLGIKTVEVEIKKGIQEIVEDVPDRVAEIAEVIPENIAEIKEDIPEKVAEIEECIVADESIARRESANEAFPVRSTDDVIEEDIQGQVFDIGADIPGEDGEIATEQIIEEDSSSDSEGEGHAMNRSSILLQSVMNVFGDSPDATGEWRSGSSGSESDEEVEEDEEVIGFLENATIISETGGMSSAVAGYVVSEDEALTQVSSLTSEESRVLVEGVMRRASSGDFFGQKGSITAAVLSIQNLANSSSQMLRERVSGKNTCSDGDNDDEKIGKDKFEPEEHYHKIIPLYHNHTVDVGEDLIETNLSAISMKPELNKQIPNAHQTSGRNSFRNIFRPDMTYCEGSARNLKSTLISQISHHSSHTSSHARVMTLLDQSHHDVTAHHSDEQLVTTEDIGGVCDWPKSKAFQHHYVHDDVVAEQDEPEEGTNDETSKLEKDTDPKNETDITKESSDIKTDNNDQDLNSEKLSEILQTDKPTEDNEIPVENKSSDGQDGNPGDLNLPEHLANATNARTDGADCNKDVLEDRQTAETTDNKPSASEAGEEHASEENDSKQTSSTASVDEPSPETHTDNGISEAENLDIDTSLDKEPEESRKETENLNASTNHSDAFTSEDAAALDRQKDTVLSKVIDRISTVFTKSSQLLQIQDVEDGRGDDLPEKDDMKTSDPSSIEGDKTSQDISDDQEKAGNDPSRITSDVIGPHEDHSGGVDNESQKQNTPDVPTLHATKDDIIQTQTEDRIEPTTPNPKRKSSKVKPVRSDTSKSHRRHTASVNKLKKTSSTKGKHPSGRRSSQGNSVKEISTTESLSKNHPKQIHSKTADSSVKTPERSHSKNVNTTARVKSSKKSLGVSRSSVGGKSRPTSSSLVKISPSKSANAPSQSKNALKSMKSSRLQDTPSGSAKDLLRSSAHSKTSAHSNDIQPIRSSTSSRSSLKKQHSVIFVQPAKEKRSSCTVILSGKRSSQTSSSRSSTSRVLETTNEGIEELVACKPGQQSVEGINNDHTNECLSNAQTPPGQEATDSLASNENTHVTDN